MAPSLRVDSRLRLPSGRLRLRLLGAVPLGHRLGRRGIPAPL